MAETKKNSFLFRMTVRTCFLLYYNFCLWNYVKELFFLRASGTSRTPQGGPCFSFAGAKVQHFRKPPKHYNTFFEKIYISTLQHIILLLRAKK